MKKLLIFMLVLGMASLVNALPTSLQISVDGVEEPIDSDIWLLPTETIELDIWTTAEIYSEGGLEGYFVIAVDSGYGSLSGGLLAAPWTETSNSMYGAGSGNSYLTPPEQGILGAIGTLLSEGNGMTGTIFDSIIFHCEAPGDAYVNLYWTDFSTLGLLDTVIIHQIPEPMTVLLLGLGGLFLRRRK